MSRSLGIPVKLLHEAAGHIVTVELKSGELYRGSMNVEHMVCNSVVIV